MDEVAQQAFFNETDFITQNRTYNADSQIEQRTRYPLSKNVCVCVVSGENSFRDKLSIKIRTI